MLTGSVINRTQNFIRTLTIQFCPHRSKMTIDKSKLPVINENDLEEHFIKGSGPGGQKINKSNNCVHILHKPSGISVKVQESRSQAENRKIARKKITLMLDNMINKENSIENQRKKILSEKSIKSAQKQRRLLELKNNWRKIISDYSCNKEE